MPRPMPDSNMDAERDRLKVTMHWYGFQVLTIRSTCASPVATCRVPSRSSQAARSAARSSSTCPGRR